MPRKPYEPPAIVELDFERGPLLAKLEAFESRDPIGTWRVTHSGSVSARMLRTESNELMCAVTFVDESNEPNARITLDHGAAKRLLNQLIAALAFGAD